MSDETSPRKIPVLYEFDWQRVSGLAEYDPATGVLTMQIERGGPVDALLSRTDPANEIRTLSFVWTPKQWVVPADSPENGE